VITEIVGEPDAQTLSQCASEAVKSTFPGMHESNPVYQAMKSKLDTLPCDAFLFVVGHGLRSTDTADDRVKLSVCVEKKTFREPAVNYAISNNGARLSFGIEYKRCALCNVEEQVSRSFKQCPCKKVFYCCKEHQVDHWSTHKLCCERKV